MASPKEEKEEGIVATSPSQWVYMVKESLGISNDDSTKNQKLWDFCVGERVFSSGSTLTLDDYLRLRVIWYTWKDVNTFGEYMRNNESLADNVNSGTTGAKSTPYTGYVSPEIDKISKKICSAIKLEWEGYLKDIRDKVGKDITRPSRACNLFYMARYNQAMTMTRTKESMDEHGKRKHIDPKTRKSAIGMESSDSTPRTPPESSPTQGSSTEFQPSPPTPRVPVVGSSAGGLQNPATSDETYVNTALLELLNIVTRLCGDLEDDKEASLDGEYDFSATASRLEGLRISPRNSDLSVALSKVEGLRHLDWLADRLPLHLQDRTGPEPKTLMEARVDGYLCRRSITNSRDGTSKVYYNKLPLAILEAKPFTRISGITPIRYQESAEIACWVSGLDDDDEEVGLLQSSTSGRKRRLLISQDRHELWIIIAEYGEEWKQYIRGQRLSVPSDSDKPLPQNTEQMFGSEGYVALVKGINRGRPLEKMMDKAERFQEQPGSTRTRSGSRANIKTPGPNHFCVMQQFGPFKTNNAGHMDLFLRRIIALQLQLLTTWPHHEPPHTEP